MMTNRRTPAAALSFHGIGIHSGLDTEAFIQPATSGGLVFVQHGVEIPARLEFLAGASYGLTLERDGQKVGVVEHLLSAFSVLGITDARIEVDGPELPIMDGSALPFLEALEETGTCELNHELRAIKVLEAIRVEAGDRWMIVEPADELEMDVSIDFDHPAIGCQHWVGSPDLTVFRKQIAPARTFGFLSDETALKSVNLAGGASVDNSLIFGDEGPLAGVILRFKDEPVRHKVLDTLGDLMLLGRPLKGRIRSHKGGHQLSVRLMRALKVL